MEKRRDEPEILLALHRIEDRLLEITNILKISQKATIEALHRSILEGSKLRKDIFKLCDGRHTVTQISKKLGRSIQQISNNIIRLQNAGLTKEVRKGKEKYYIKMR